MRDRTDDSDDDERPRTRRARVVTPVTDDDESRPGLPRWLVFSLAFGGAAAVVVAVIVVGLIGRGAVKAQQRADAAVALAAEIAAKEAVAAAEVAAKEAKVDAKETKVFDRQDFRTAVIQKTPAELIMVLGKPHETSETALGYPDEWTYRYRSFDPVAKKTDSSAVLHFRNGIVTRVFFYP